jgi:hypothetical protein
VFCAREYQINRRVSIVGLAFSISCLSTPPSWDGGTAVLEAISGANRVSTNIQFNDGDLRMSAAVPGLDGYMVSGMGGCPMVLDLGAVKSMMGGIAGEMIQSQGITLNNGIG